MLGLAFVGHIHIHVELRRTLDNIGHKPAGQSVFTCAHQRRKLLGRAGDNHADMRLPDLFVDRTLGTMHAGNT